LAGARAALPQTFGVLPKADIGVKRMDPFLEVGQTIAFYDRARRMDRGRAMCGSIFPT
jgi:uncharacterized protein (DUF885 family)